jgi:predicted Zn-dependent protease
LDLKASSQYSERRHPDLALFSLQASLSKQPNNIQALLLHTDALAIMEKFDEAHSAADAVLKQEPHNRAALVLRTRINLSTGRF